MIATQTKTDKPTLLLSQQQLLDQLGIDVQTLRRWVREGMPTRRRNRSRVFDSGEVMAWLEQSGKLDPPEPVARTRMEAAQYFGVSERTFAQWCVLPGFPGKPGSQGMRNAYFPLRQIGEWREARGLGGDDSQLGQAQLALKQVQLEIKRHELARLRAESIDVSVATGIVERSIASARSVLSGLPDSIAAVVPGLTDEQRAGLIVAAAQQVQQALAEIATAVLQGQGGDEE